MNKFPKVGEQVRITVDVGKDFVDDMIAVVEYRDGEYIYVRTLKKRVIMEKYICELEPYPAEEETPGQQCDRWATLYKKEPGITREYQIAKYGSAAKIRTSHYGIELWRYRFSWESNSIVHNIDVHADTFDNIDDFVDYAEMIYTLGERRRK